jgi:hypothetical protein
MSDAAPVSGFETVARTGDLPVNSLKAVVLSNGDKVCLVRTSVGR